MSKITVTSTAERFRRAGITFTREPLELDTARLTPAQVDAIRKEPNLSVHEGGEHDKKPSDEEKKPDDAKHPHTTHAPVKTAKK